jgi:hypothetical protein
MTRCLHRIILELQTLKYSKMENTKNEKQCDIHDVSVSLYTENEAKELAYEILWASTPSAYKIFADRKTFEHRWEELIRKKN